MKREDAKFKLGHTTDTSTRIIDKLFDELEKEVCENCTNFIPNISKYGEYEGECSFGYIQERDLETVKIDFGCNKFNAKTN